jgi:hypothetical protein
MERSWSWLLVALKIQVQHVSKRNSWAKASTAVVVGAMEKWEALSTFHLFHGPFRYSIQKCSSSREQNLLIWPNSPLLHLEFERGLYKKRAHRRVTAANGSTS